MLAIHPVHRKLAELVYMNTDMDGNFVVDQAALKLILPLLRQNMLLVQELDSLKELSFIAYCSGDFEWVQQIEVEIEKLQAQCIL